MVPPNLRLPPMNFIDSLSTQILVSVFSTKNSPSSLEDVIFLYGKLFADWTCFQFSTWHHTLEQTLENASSKWLPASYVPTHTLLMKTGLISYAGNPKHNLRLTTRSWYLYRWLFLGPNTVRSSFRLHVFCLCPYMVISHQFRFNYVRFKISKKSLLIVPLEHLL